MADKNEEVTLKSVFKDLASELKEAITSSAPDDPETKKTDEELAAEKKVKEEAEAKVKADAEAKVKADEKAAAEKKGEEEGDGDKPESATKADVDAVAADLATIKELLTAEDGDFRTALGNLVKTAANHGEVLEKVIERLEKLEGNTAVSKSIEGDDSGGDTDDDETTPVEKAQAAGMAGLTKAVTHMARNPKGAPVGQAVSDN